MGYDSLAFFKSEITPYKGELECWYAENKNIKLYFILIFITAWVIFVPKSKIIWVLLKVRLTPTNL